LGNSKLPPVSFALELILVIIQLERVVSYFWHEKYTYTAKGPAVTVQRRPGGLTDRLTVRPPDWRSELSASATNAAYV